MSDLTDREQTLYEQLSEAIVLADGEAISAADLLITAVAEFLDVDTYEIGKPLPSLS